MNKYEFKSAYDKITLSEDFKREAREKLLAIAGGDRSAAVTHTGEYGDRAVEIKSVERRKSPAKTIIGIISAAAVLAVCVVGGGYLIKKHGGDILVTSESNVTERQWLDYETALEISLSDSEKPYSPEFAKVRSEFARNNDYSFNYITAYPCGNDYFAVKEYSYPYASPGSYYYEIYLISGDETKLLADFESYHYKTLIGDGEYLYFICENALYRISSKGNTEEISDLTEFDPEPPSAEMELMAARASASGSGDYLTLDVTYIVLPVALDDIKYTYTHVINVVTLEEVGYEYTDEEMPIPFADTGADECYMFYQPFESYFAEIPETLTSGFSVEEVDGYFNSFDIVNDPSDNIMGYPNIYSFIRYFDIRYDDVREALSFMTESNKYNVNDQVLENFIISDNAEYTSNYFGNEYSIVAGNKIYSPNWLYLHTVEDWIEADIIGSGLSEIAEKYCEFPFEEDARIAFEEKLEQALGYHVSLEYKPRTDKAEAADSEPTYDGLATIDENGNFVWSGHTGSAYIELQPLTAVPASEFDESRFNTFDNPVTAATEAIDRYKFHGIRIVGQVAESDTIVEYIYPLDDTHGVDMGKTSRFNPRVMLSYTLDAQTSIYNDSMVSLHYTNDYGGEFYINIAEMAYQGDSARYVTDDNNNIYAPKATDGIYSYVMSESDFSSHNFTGSYEAFSAMYIGGKQVDGVNYFYAHRKSGDRPDDIALRLSAKGCTLDSFMDLIAAVVQCKPSFSDYNSYTIFESRTFIYNDGEITGPAIPEFDPKSVETEQGTLVLNQGKYLGTGAGYNYEVNTVILGSEPSLYTKEDMTEFTGNNALFELPLGFEPTETKIGYAANYAEFHDGYNIQLFHEGRPLIGESEDADFIEAHGYFAGGYCYSYDKLPYFENKTPMVQVYNADFSDGSASVTVSAYKGDFSQRYMGFGFQFLPAEPSNLCEDYYIDYVYEQGNGEDSLSRIFAASYENSMDETLRGCYYGGFYKDGIYYVVTAKNIDAQAFADILAALYQG